MNTTTYTDGRTKVTFHQDLQSALAESASMLNRDDVRSVATAKIGRNDPCPCGSGRKFKKCCISKMQGGT